MPPRTQSRITSLAAAIVLLALVMLLANALAGEQTARGPQAALPSSQAQTATPVALATTTVSVPTHATTTITTKSPAVAATPATPSKTTAQSKPTPPDTSSSEIRRTENPYSFAPLSFEQINVGARTAVVNIFCMPEAGTLRPVSASGVLIDSRGIILTNAHVAQYILLSESPQIDLSCTVRTGSPASPHWKARVLYMPPAWVAEHAKDINATQAIGTGEHDWALLRIVATTDGSALPASFPFLQVDTREAIAFLDDQILAVGYPAEFVGGITAQLGLYAASSVTTVKQMLTFHTGTVDVLSLGGVIEAQGGSSGGPVVNAWDRLVGIITTTSEGTTTASRDLRAITLSYINRDMAALTGSDLYVFLNVGDIAEKERDFHLNTAPSLLQQFFDQLER